MLKEMFKFAQVSCKDNVRYEVRDKNGNLKPLFTENFLGKFILKTIRKYVLKPIDDNGQVKPGLKNYLGAYGLRIPFLFGRWRMHSLKANLVTNAGKAGAASRINGAGAEAAFTSIGMGTGVTAAAATDTALELGKKGDGTADAGVHVLPTASVTATRVTTTTTNDTAQLSGTAAITATLAITESGVFNADTAGTMLCRQTFSAISLVSGDNLSLTWKIKVS